MVRALDVQQCFSCSLFYVGLVCYLLVPCSKVFYLDIQDMHVIQTHSQTEPSSVFSNKSEFGMLSNKVKCMQKFSM